MEKKLVCLDVDGTIVDHDGHLHEPVREAVKAVVVMKPGKQATATDIINFTRERIAGYKTPNVHSPIAGCTYAQPQVASVGVTEEAARAELAAPLLAADGHEVTSVIRNPKHAEEVTASGATPLVRDIESLFTGLRVTGQAADLDEAVAKP